MNRSQLLNMTLAAAVCASAACDPIADAAKNLTIYPHVFQVHKGAVWFQNPLHTSQTLVNLHIAKEGPTSASHYTLLDKGQGQRAPILVFFQTVTSHW